MPEIIEAEITKQKLAPASGGRILDFWSDWPRGLYSQKKTVWLTKKSLRGKCIKDVARAGKVVVFNLEGGKVLAIHQRMSGHIMYGDSDDPKTVGDHIRVRVVLDNGKCFALRDPRKFGTVWYGTKNWFGKQSYIRDLGTDAFDITKSELKKLCGSSSASLKSFLLRQDIVAGLGNIAVDESLWRAKLAPQRKVDSLNEEELSRLHEGLYRTLVSVLRNGGTSMSDWRHPDGKKGSYQKRFMIYKRSSCRRCKKSVKRSTVAGRGTYACSGCQE